VTGFSVLSVHQYVLFHKSATESELTDTGPGQCYAFFSCAMSEGAALANPAMEQLCGKRAAAGEEVRFTFARHFHFHRSDLF
jgi:hypothetical protein